MTGLELPLLTIALLLCASFVAGWVDSIVGGGGLIQLPALLIGLPEGTSVPTVSGTNKVASSLGTLTAAATYLRRVTLPWGALVPLIAASAVGSMLGAQATHLLDRRSFIPLVLLAIVVVGFFTWRRPQLGQARGERLMGAAAVVRPLGVGLLVGLWDGFIGPGTGTFYLIAIVTLLREDFLRATAVTKVANLTTNIAAIGVFGLSGNVLWGLGLTLGVANICGSLLGARMALRHGNQFVRRVFLVVVVVLGLKLALDLAMGV